eukprot:CAMPEP_0177631394 /NCGR_PEP_ID=MMETSP0447-20121125/1728_1 /TAXON_ID=0 /ORGANISM="Stygamoeba regulata, Strain BSH-02190019" /LENGTH=262 /DNA_ID=CAMNT_0019132879 /DNA_START=52 /DNA_END=840 /DNA_ORIENTATION=-
MVKVNEEFLIEMLRRPVEAQAGSYAGKPKTPRSVATGPLRSPRAMVPLRTSTDSKSSKILHKAKASAAAEMTIQNPFDTLHTQTGIDNLKLWFQMNAPTGKMDENQFIKVLRALSDFRDYEIIEIFDIFDPLDEGMIVFDDFFLLLAMLAARLTGQSTQFLYRHGKQMFQLCSSSEDTSQKITYEQFSRLGVVIGVNEMHISAALKGVNFSVFDLISYDDFMLFWFAILDDLDRGISPADTFYSAADKDFRDFDKDKACTLC